jgi:hypothetical protein
MNLTVLKPIRNSFTLHIRYRFLESLAHFQCLAAGGGGGMYGTGLPLIVLRVEVVFFVNSLKVRLNNSETSFL